jgi:hypothetical protein
MRLAAIYCVWGDANDLLQLSIDNIEPVVDGVIVVYSNTSNYGNTALVKCTPKPKVNYTNWEPNTARTPHDNETDKRNYGLNLARNSGYTHFIMLDADEFYEQSAFKIEKEYIEQNDVIGKVCKTKVYFKKPTLTIGFDHTLVPFIHKITPGLQFHFNHKTYPFAYDDQGNAHIDPTRRLNITRGIEWTSITMHHYSWVRSDYNIKIENSAASKNLKKSGIYSDLEKAAEGVYNEFYRKTLTTCDNLFNIPEL